MQSYAVLDPVSQAYPTVQGRLPTCYSPVRRSCTPKGLTARLACVKHAASVRPEPGSNSPIMNWSWLKNQFILSQRNPKKGAISYWRYRHTVEFSKNTRTPPRTTLRAVRSGATYISYTVRFAASTRSAQSQVPLPSNVPWERFPRRLRQALASCSVRQRESYAPVAVKSNRLVRGLTSPCRHCPCACLRRASPLAATTARCCPSRSPHRAPARGWPPAAHRGELVRNPTY